jgi:hypothetical protein
MATEFFIIVPKRDDGKVYADVQKAVWGALYSTESEAQSDLDAMKFRANFIVVPLIAMTKEEYEEMK